MARKTASGVRRIPCTGAHDYKPCDYILEPGGWAESYSARSGASQGLRRVWHGRKCEAPASFAAGGRCFCTEHAPGAESEVLDVEVREAEEKMGALLSERLNRYEIRDLDPEVVAAARGDLARAKRLIEGVRQKLRKP